ncbi:anthranilate phosphoribosyltransferase, partial [Streptomyces sp. SID5926]|nr:anthranilate phosphoribosyltransferase [Streptomyces sp. SID5926]
DVVLLNAAAALRVAGLAGTWSDGLRLAASAVDGGAAADLLDRWAHASWQRADLVEVPA